MWSDQRQMRTSKPWFDPKAGPFHAQLKVTSPETRAPSDGLSSVGAGQADFGVAVATGVVERGRRVGVDVGIAVGVDVGGFVGVAVGVDVGGFVGIAVGVDVGSSVGVRVGVSVGGTGVSVGVGVDVSVGGAGVSVSWKATTVAVGVGDGVTQERRREMPPRHAMMVSPTPINVRRADQPLRTGSPPAVLTAVSATGPAPSMAGAWSSGGLFMPAPEPCAASSSARRLASTAMCALV